MPFSPASCQLPFCVLMFNYINQPPSTPRLPISRLYRSSHAQAQTIFVYAYTYTSILHYSTHYIYIEEQQQPVHVTCVCERETVRALVVVPPIFLGFFFDVKRAARRQYKDQQDHRSIFVLFFKRMSKENRLSLSQAGGELGWFFFYSRD